MSDARWFEVDRDIAAAVKHFSRSVQLFEKGGFGGDAIEAYAAQMAFLHAMQSGHTSLEVALVRILDLMEEQAPTGADWHADLIRRAVRPFPGRPAGYPAARSRKGCQRDPRFPARRNARLRDVRRRVSCSSRS